MDIKAVTRDTEHWEILKVSASVIYQNERASLASTTRNVAHHLLALGPSAVSMGESYFWELKFKVLTL